MAYFQELVGLTVSLCFANEESVTMHCFSYPDGIRPTKFCIMMPWRYYSPKDGFRFCCRAKELPIVGLKIEKILDQSRSLPDGEASRSLTDVCVLFSDGSMLESFSACDEDDAFAVESDLNPGNRHVF